MPHPPRAGGPVKTSLRRISSSPLVTSEVISSSPRSLPTRPSLPFSAISMTRPDELNSNGQQNPPPRSFSTSTIGEDDRPEYTSYFSFEARNKRRRSSTRAYPAAFKAVASIETEMNSSGSVYHLAGLVNDVGGKYEKYRMKDEDIQACDQKKVRQFYERQNAILDSFLEVDELLDATPVTSFEEINGETTSLLPKYQIQSAADKEQRNKNLVKWTVNVNLLINAILLTMKILVVIVSNSMSLIASVVDSAMDFLSTVLLFGASRAIESKDWRRKYTYPVGLRRAEPMAVVVFSVFMIASFIQVLIESFKRLIAPELEAVVIPLNGVIVMLVTIAVKIVVWRSSRGSKSSTVQALSQDAENDVVFNTFSLIFPWIGQRFGIVWLDPLGGLLLSLYIIIEWVSTLRSNIRNLMGARSGPDEHQRVAYLVTRFSPQIKALQHIEVYSSGDQLIAEVDLVLPADISLPKAHNIGESVQYALESLSGIERAYCHVDYNPNNPYGHVVR